MFKEKQILDNWNKFLDIIESNIKGDRKDKLLTFYDKYSDRISVMPASINIYYHNCFPGGYVDHVLRVVSLSEYVQKMFDIEGKCTNFTNEERIFSTINHDLGKSGTDNGPYFIQEDRNWYRGKGFMYRTNDEKIGFMKSADRSLFLLQSNSIEMSESEYLAIKLHDGLFEDANASYYHYHNPKVRLEKNLIQVIHIADYIATNIEKGKNTNKALKYWKING